MRVCSSLLAAHVDLGLGLADDRELDAAFFSTSLSRRPRAVLSTVLLQSKLRHPMGSSVSLIVPRWQYKYGPGNKFSNQVVRNRLKERLHSDNYAPYLVEAGQVNEAMREAIVSIAGDKQIENEMDVDTEIEECRTEIPKRRLTVELLVATLSRLRNQNILNFFSVVLSVIALARVSVFNFGLSCVAWVFFSVECGQLN